MTISNLFSSIEGKIVEGVGYADNKYREAICGYSENTKWLLKYAPVLIAATGAYLLQAKTSVITGLSVIVINLRNPKIISDQFAGKLTAGIAGVFVSKMILSSIKTFSLFALALATLYVSLNYGQTKSSLCKYIDNKFGSSRSSTSY